MELLDGLRGIAAVVVMLYHVETMFGDYGLFSRGYLFVDFFFLLSGFVLTMAAEPKMRSGQSALSFLKLRLARLWPVIAVGTLIGALCYGLLDGWQGKGLEVALGLALVPMVWSAGQIFPLNGPQWSLLLEIIANLIHGLVLHRMDERALLAVVLVSGAMLAAVIFTFGSNTLGPFAFNWWYSIPRVAFAYPLGILLARKWQRCEQARPILSWQASLLLPPLVVVALVGMPIPHPVGDALVTLVVMPFLFWIACHASPPEQARLWLGRLGAISFPLYAVHAPLIELFSRHGHGLAWKLSAIAASLFAAQLLAMTLERRKGGMKIAVSAIATRPA